MNTRFKHTSACVRLQSCIIQSLQSLNRKTCDVIVGMNCWRAGESDRWPVCVCVCVCLFVCVCVSSELVSFGYNLLHVATSI